ncbi:MAG: RIP metalloprotease RseP [Peptococcaceae bacterium]
MQTAIFALIIFGLLIFVHEFGHFIVAKLVGVRVEEFSIGMGPQAFSFTKGETLYSIRILPIGGYVKMSGESGVEEEDSLAAADPKRFNNKSVGQRAGVIVAGPLMNFILAVLLFTMIFAFIGIPYGTTQIGEVLADSPAADAGLKSGDVIVNIDGEKVNDWSEMVEIIHNKPGIELDFTLQRGDALQNVRITPKLDEENHVGLIGVTPSEEVKKVNVFEAFSLGINRTVEILVFTIVALVEMFTGQMGMGEVTGPVGIVQLIGESAQIGLIYLVNLTALISINLGLLNLLPIPALDGSKLIFLSIEAIRGKPIDARKENFVHIIGFALLMTLMLFITYRDVIKLFE